MGAPARTEEEITTCLMALVAWAGNVKSATTYLKSEKGIAIAPATLASWKQTHGLRYDELRDKYAGQLEGKLAHEMRDVAMLAVQTQRLAIAQAEKRLKSGEDSDPARSAANLSRVAQSATDKLMTLTSRPTQITETRDIGAVLRSLAAKGVLEIPAPEVTVADGG